MPKRKRKAAAPGHTRFALELTSFAARVDASIGYKVRVSRDRLEGDRVYEFASSVELGGICTYPGERAGDEYLLTVRGAEPSPSLQAKAPEEQEPLGAQP